MFSTPAHKQTDPAKLPAQTVTPVASQPRVLADYIAQVQALDTQPVVPLLQAARQLEIAANNFRRKQLRSEVDPTPASRESLRSAGLILDAALAVASRSIKTVALLEEQIRFESSRRAA